MGVQAALWDNAELLEDLLRGEQIAHLNSQDSWGRTPLHAAATSDNSRCLNVLLEAGGIYENYLYNLISEINLISHILFLFQLTPIYLVVLEVKIR